MWQSSPDAEAVDLKYLQVVGGYGQLVGLGPDKIVLLDASADYPLRLSQDGGQSWQVISLPSLPATTDGQPGRYPNLQMLPNGSLAALINTSRAEQTRWVVLPPQGSRWCTVTNALVPPSYVATQLIGNRLWWETVKSDNYAVTLQSLPVSDLHC